MGIQMLLCIQRQEKYRTKTLLYKVCLDCKRKRERAGESRKTLSHSQSCQSLHVLYSSITQLRSVSIKKYRRGSRKILQIVTKCNEVTKTR